MIPPIHHFCTFVTLPNPAHRSVLASDGKLATFPLHVIKIRQRWKSRHVAHGLHLFSRVLSNESDTLLDVLLEVAQASFDKLLLSGVDLANGQDLLDAVGAQLDLAGEEVNALVLVEG